MNHSHMDEPWVLLRYIGPHAQQRAAVQALQRSRWDYLTRVYSNDIFKAWELIAEGTQEEMQAFEKLTGVNK